MCLNVIYNEEENILDTTENQINDVEETMRNFFKTQRD